MCLHSVMQSYFQSSFVFAFSCQLQGQIQLSFYTNCSLDVNLAKVLDIRAFRFMHGDLCHIGYQMLAEGHSIVERGIRLVQKFT